jgi:hypothetical protein
MNCQINSSQLATLVGKNPYGNISELILKYWKKVQPKIYKQYFEQNKNKNKLETDSEIIKRLANKHKLDLRKDIKKVTGSNDIVTMKNERNETLKKIKLLPKQDQLLLKEKITSLTNKNFGTKKEFDVVKIYCQHMNCEVNRINKLYKKPIISHNNINWKIVGKIDGIKDNGTVVEIKNRMHRLFNALREYEKVQVMSYLFLLDKQQCDLVEGYKGNINIISIPFDLNYWNNEIYHKILLFIKFFDIFLNDDQMKNIVINSDNNTIFDIINNC